MRNTYFNLTLFSLAIMLSASTYADVLTGRVVGVADGDTVTVLDDSRQQYKIRLMGIDAPEKKMPFGNRSKQALSELVFDRQVQIEYSKNDKYGRIVGKIIVGGVDANLAQIKAGMAWHYKQYQREQTEGDRIAYALAEDDAKVTKRGLWKDADPMPPWEWRKQQKKKE